jgi:hypothetical protein
MTPEQWIEKARKQIKDNQDCIAEFGFVSSCDWKAYQHYKSVLARCNRENSLLSEAIKLLQEKNK